MKRALFYVYLDTHFVEMRRVADAIAHDGAYAPVFMFAYRYPMVEADIAACRKARYASIDARGRPIFDLDGDALGLAGYADAAAVAAAQPAAQPSLAQQIVKRALGILPPKMRGNLSATLAGMRNASLRQLLLSLIYPRLGMLVTHLRSQEALARQILAHVSPAIIILPEDNIEYLTGALIRAAREQGIGSVIVPYTIANAEEIAEAYWHNPDYSLNKWRNRLVGALHPRWVYKHRGRKLIPLPADRILATELLGLAPPLPWIINSGDADAIAAESPFMARYYEAAGLPAKQLVLTGALYDDILYKEAVEARTGDVRARLGLVSSKPLLLCALPPDQYSSKRPGAEFPSYAAMVRAWADALAAANAFDVVVRLHPRTLRSEVSYIETEYGLRISEIDTAALIPHCDLYVASVSATIRAAVATGKPVLNYDCYRFRYHDFQGVPAVLTVEDLSSFRGALKKLSVQSYRAGLSAKQAAFAREANLLDGRAHERMLRLINSRARK